MSLSTQNNPAIVENTKAQDLFIAGKIANATFPMCWYYYLCEINVGIHLRTNARTAEKIHIFLLFKFNNITFVIK